MVDYASNAPNVNSLLITRTPQAGSSVTPATNVSTWQRIVIAGLTNANQLAAQRAYVASFFPNSVFAPRPRGVEGLLYPAQG